MSNNVASSPKCVLNMHKKSLFANAAFSGFIRQQCGTNKETVPILSLRKTVSTESKRLLNAIVFRIYIYDLLSLGALVEESRVYFKCTIYSEGTE